MSIKFKIIHGTRSDSENLCVTCRNFTIIKGAAESQEQIFCNAVPRPYGKMERPVVLCSDYSDKRQPSLGDMRDMAFYLVAKKGGPAGFITAKQFRKGKDSEEYYQIDDD